MPAQKVDFVTGKAEVKQMIDGLLESRGQQERTLFGKPANAQLERCCLIRFSVSEIGCRHGQLVKIREQSSSSAERRRHERTVYAISWERGRPARSGCILAFQKRR